MKILSFLFLLIWAFTLTAKPPAKVKSSRFVFPIYPGKRASLSGTFAELRPDHYHSGIDIRTGGVEGLPVVATDGGYISRIFNDKSGYGLVLFLRHPNGYQSIYAHLKGFNEKVNNYIQRAGKPGEDINFSLNPKSIPVKKGELIGYSGNTGRSAGPHLHFEVRNEHNQAINTLAWNFPEIRDETPPIVERLAFLPITSSGRILGKFERTEHSILEQKSSKKSVREYFLKDTLFALGGIGVEILSHDIAEGSNGRNGIQCLEMKVNGEEVFYHHPTSIDFSISKDINLHLDFAEYLRSGRMFQRCFLTDGNRRLPYFRPASQLNILPDSLYKIEVSLWDTHQNKTTVRAFVRGRNIATSMPSDTTRSWSINDNTLVFKGKGSDSTKFFVGGKAIKIPAAYPGHWLFDLRKNLPDSAENQGITIKFPYLEAVFPNINKTVSGKRFSVAFTKDVLYDTLYFRGTTEQNTFILTDGGTPLKKDVTVAFQPEKNLRFYAKTAAYLIRERPIFLGGSWVKNRLVISTDALGKFALLTDARSPKLSPIQIDSTTLIFKAFDELSGIRSWKASVNGEEIRLLYDANSGTLYAPKMANEKPFSGELQVEITDKCYNRAIFVTQDLRNWQQHVVPKKRKK